MSTDDKVYVDIFQRIFKCNYSFFFFFSMFCKCISSHLMSERQLKTGERLNQSEREGWLVRQRRRSRVREEVKEGGRGRGRGEVRREGEREEEIMRGSEREREREREGEGERDNER